MVRPRATGQGAGRDRHRCGAYSARLQLLAGRRGQLCGGPGRRRGGHCGVSRHPRQRPCAAGVPRPCRRISSPGRPGSRSSWTSAPACRPPTTPMRSRNHRAAVPHRLRRQRPDRAGARPGTAGEQRMAQPPTWTLTCAIPARSYGGCGLLDFGPPIAVMLLAILHFIPDRDRPARDRRPADGRAPIRQPPRDGSPGTSDITSGGG